MEHLFLFVSGPTVRIVLSFSSSSSRKHLTSRQVQGEPSKRITGGFTAASLSHTHIHTPIWNHCCPVVTASETRCCWCLWLYDCGKSFRNESRTHKKWQCQELTDFTELDVFLGQHIFCWSSDPIPTPKPNPTHKLFLKSERKNTDANTAILGNKHTVDVNCKLVPNLWMSETWIQELVG